jgi:hypothetical protein
MKRLVVYFRDIAYSNEAWPFERLELNGRVGPSQHIHCVGMHKADCEFQMPDLGSMDVRRKIAARCGMNIQLYAQTE